MQAVVIEAQSDQAQADALLALLPTLMPQPYNYARYLMEADEARDAVAAALEHLGKDAERAADVERILGGQRPGTRPA